MLKLMCIRDFPNPASSVISTSMRMDRIAGSDVYASLILLFAALSSHPASCSRMMRGLNLPLWFISVHYTSDFIGLPNALNLQHAWRKLEKHVTKLVLVAMEHVLKSEYMLLKDSVDFLPMVQIYRDLIGVLRDRSSDPEMLYSAADSLLTCMEIRGEFRRTLDIVLAEGRLEDTISIFRTVHLCLA
ncbi:hypothetical protein EW026_g1758 [Hermanssonia centrifuga]|uniref:Uncharacterized protein n=1 Tax=Hermanssonia centrifuga TaxID=98765 RepID=A0A4S4KUW3_9APHY|nr:hypothetical protein EW026_g1758 [Hermanssonia centrifuga]